MKVRVELPHGEVNSGLEEVITFRSGTRVYADLKKATNEIELAQGKRVYIYGDVFYHLKGGGNVMLLDSESKDYLKRLFSEYELKDIISSLEGQYLGLLMEKKEGRVHIFGDRYARVDSFYAQSAGRFFFATELDFVFAHIRPEYDQKMLAHLLLTYGWYTPKGLTIYNNVRQLRVGEIISLSEYGMHSQIIEHEPLEIENYTDKDLQVYYDILRESIISRANRKGKTWISSSSGWDSSLLLGMIVQEFGPEHTGMISGSMRYSEGTAVINAFEINKIKKIAAYYGIKPIIVNFDFKSKRAPEYWEKIIPYYKSKHVYTFTTFNFSRLSDALQQGEGQGQIVFNGEVSDSFHNFGFSQYTTFFHSKKPFTEYGDKMNCYLYGPSFFKKVIDGVHKKDKVFQIFRAMMGNIEYEDILNGKESAIEAYLFPFFYGSPRIPFAKTYRNPLLTERGGDAICHFPFREYMPQVLSSLSERNIYSWLIYLYQSFHAQGSTVSVQKHAMERNGHGWRCPFNDMRLIDYLSRAPEEWGRGLELNNTKYPLKWVAKNKIRFPYDLLDEGPHSYLYDVIEGFSLMAEITYRSGMTDFFKEAVKTGAYIDILDDDYFDIAYLDKIVEGYLSGTEISGVDFSNLVALITLCITGWY